MPVSLTIIPDGDRSAAFNMAADLYLLSICTVVPSVYVRFYTWEQPTVTIGYMQRAAKVLDICKLTQDGGCWIRRPTGGRAVLHGGDITYSVIFARKILTMGATVLQTYRIISESLMAGLSRAGIAGEPHDSLLDTRMLRREGKLPCFLAPNREEIMVGEKKLVGSAQKRTGSAVLQHGSIPLTPSFRNLPDYSRISEKQRCLEKELFRRKCTCTQELAPSLSKETLVSCLKQGFTEVLPFEALERTWNREELDAVARLSWSEDFRAKYMK